MVTETVHASNQTVSLGQGRFISFEMMSSEIQAELMTEYQLEAERLIKQLSYKVFEKLPSYVLSKLEGKLLSVMISSKLQSVDALFVDPDDLVTFDELFERRVSPVVGAKKIILVLSLKAFISKNAVYLLAHEVFHAIHFLIREGAPSWVREGLATLFEARVRGRLTEKMVDSFLASKVSLTRSHNHKSHSMDLYAHQAMFFHYLSYQCFGGDFPWKLLDLKVSHWGSLLSGICHEKSGLDELIRNFFIAQYQNQIFSNDQKMDTRFIMNIPFYQTRSFEKKAQIQNLNLSPFDPIFVRGFELNSVSLDHYNAKHVIYPIKIENFSLEILEKLSAPYLFDPQLYYLIYTTDNLF